MVKTKVVSGPSSYTTGGFEVTLGEFEKVTSCLVTAIGLAQNQVIDYAVSGNKVTIKVYTISADTGTGAISGTEVGAGTDLSGVTFQILYDGI